MPALSDKRLKELLAAALPGMTVVGEADHTKPIVVKIPEIGLVRIYLWTTTPDASATGRPKGEHKAQIIIPGTARKSRQHLNLKDMPVALLGYSPVFGVFTAWQAELHHDSAWSKNLQFKEEMLAAGVESGWAVDMRQLREAKALEVRVAVHPLHLPLYLRLMIQADSMGLNGAERRDFFDLNRPTTQLMPLLADETAFTPNERQLIASLRRERDSRFSRHILREFNGACAVCHVQLSIVEAAHVIPVHDARSRDEVWNGIALCRNHHRLFDRHILLIRPDGIIQPDDEKLAFLTEAKRLGGFEHCLKPYLNQPIQKPSYWKSNPKDKRRFTSALEIAFAG